MDIYLTNNLTNKKEQFVPRNNKEVGMYVCGPTVYDDPHIGNARPLVVFDLLFKFMFLYFFLGIELRQPFRFFNKFIQRHFFLSLGIEK